MSDDFDLSQIPTTSIYSESDNTKNARHKYYQTKTKATFIQLIPSAILILGIIFLIIFLSNYQINIKEERYTLMYIAIALFVISIIGFAIMSTIINNILEPLKQDIQRSIVNDQLKLTGANINTNNNVNTNNNINTIQYTTNEDKEKYENEIKELKSKINTLVKDLSDEQEMKITIKEQNKLIKKYENIIKKLEYEVEMLENQIYSIKLTESQTREKKIKQKQEKRHNKILKNKDTKPPMTLRKKILLGVALGITAIFVATLILLVINVVAHNLSIGLIVTNALLPIVIIILFMVM